MLKLPSRLDRPRQAAGAVESPLNRRVAERLGAQAGEQRLREVAEQAGFSRFRRATDTSFNLVLEARP
jgi:hypothetical protein